MKSKTPSLLYDEHPLVINPQLARLIGLNEAIVLQQVHYWVTLNEKAGRNLQEGYYWTYNTFREWQLQFPFWSIRTIKTVVKNLERLGLLIPANYNKLRQDRTKWYRVNHDACTLQGANIAPSNDQSCTMEGAAIAPPLPETTPETTPETKAKDTVLTLGSFNNVILSQKEYDSLIDRFGECSTLARIENLSLGISSKGYKYKSHYATILNWARRDNHSIQGKDGDDTDKYIKQKYGHIVHR